VRLGGAASDNAHIAILTFDSDEGKSVFWHTSSHILAQAVQEIFPSAKIAIGRPSITVFTMISDVDQSLYTAGFTKNRSAMQGNRR